VSTKHALPLCKDWLRKCCASHDACKSPKQNPLPTRLLAITDDEARLCLSEELEGCPKYATLSHCWGTLKFLTLKKKTLVNFRKRVPAEALPKTFQDAIYIAKYLGFQYLWIDSLCIVQDDTDDRKRESALMTNVYSGSALNIAASSAADGSIGCFFDRKSTWRCQIRAILNDKIEFYECFPYSELWSRQKIEPLERRGWVVQERFLSQRIIHFTTEQIFWECDEKSACEMFLHGYPSGIVSIFGMENRPATRLMWDHIVALYSACQLTMSRDKLVAIAGLAEFIQTQTGDEYVAGLWRNNLELQLCWLSEGGGRRMPHSAPTWSWASIDSPVWVRGKQDTQPSGRLC
jgi:hypothetical protein